MNPSVYNLSSNQIRSYLTLSGWHPVNCNDRCWVFEGYKSVDGKPFEIVLPKQESAPDYPVYVEHTIRILSALTDKSPTAISNEILLFDRDLLTIGIAARSVNLDAANMANIKRLIGYSANAERNLKPFFTQYYGAARSMLDHFEIYDHRNGAVGYRVESQVGDELPYQPALMAKAPDPGVKRPLERRVMERIATGLLAVDKAARMRDAAPIVDGYPDGFNANMCDAVKQMSEQSPAPIQYGVVWSRKLTAMIGAENLNQVSIERYHIEFLKAASDKLRQKELKPDYQQLAGRVIGLSSSGDPNSDDVDERSVVLLWQPRRAAERKLRANLDKRAYKTAIKAHRDWATVSVDGIVVQRRSHWELADPQDFKILR